jgi:hypothetical protein
VINEVRAGGVAQVVECLPSKPEALSLNSSATTIKRKKLDKIRHNNFVMKIYRP